MSSKTSSVWVSVFILTAGALAACGGVEGRPLLGGRLSAEYQGTAFTPTFGIAFERDAQTKLLIFGDQDIGCESPLDDEPPAGHFSTLGLRTFEVGDYDNVIVNMQRNIGGEYHGRGSNAGRVRIEMSSAETVTGTIAYQHDDDEGLHYELNGDFEVTRCPL